MSLNLVRDRIRRQVRVTSVVADVKLCLTRAQFSTIIDALTEYRGRVVNQSVEHVDDGTADSVLYYLLTQAQENCGITVAECEEVLDCLESETGAAIVQSVASTRNVYYQTNILRERDRLIETLIQPTSGECNDFLFNTARRLTDLAADAIIDAMQRLAGGREVAIAGLADALSRVTVIDESSADAVVGVINWLTNNLIGAFEAADSPLLRDEFACAVFCRVKDTCSITVAEFMAVAESKAGAAFPPIRGAFDIIVWLTSLASVAVGAGAEGVFYAGMYVFFAMTRWVDSVLQVPGLDQRALAKIFAYMRAYLDDGDDDWVDLCECGSEFCVQYDTVAENEFSVVNYAAFTPTNLGNWVSGTGYVSSTIRVNTGTTRTHGVAIERAFSLTTLSRVEVLYNKTNGAFTAAPSPRRMSIQLFRGTTLVVDTGLIGPSVPGSNVNFVWDGPPVVCDRIVVRDDSSYRPSASGANGSVVIKRVTLYGSGDRPAGGSDCV